MKLVNTSIATLVAALTLVTSANAHSVSKKDHKNCDFIPKNNLYIPEGMELAGGITEADFNRVIDKVSAFYGPVITAKGGTLKVNRLWSDGTVNASAQRSGKTWVLNMYGGLARHPITTAEGFTLVMCHELGHHLGGFPKTGSIFGSSWAANEGQADYFATMKCARKVFESDNNMIAISSLQIPAIVQQKCSTQFKSAAEISLCARSSMAGLNLANLLHSLASSTPSVISAKAAPQFETPDTSEVNSTNSAHPAAQCRLDTYFAGAVCGVSANEEFGQTEATTGACAEEKGDSFGVRPRCWYKPSKR